MELYFWILIGAILLVSLTILLARPSPKNNNYRYDYDNLEGLMGETAEGEPVKTNSNQTNIEENKGEAEEELPQEVIEKFERRKWALGFVIFGSTFIMMGAILLFLSEFEFTTFLGSCMMYVGIIALIKGGSFELQKDNIYNSFFSAVFFLLIFFMNLILLTELLGVIGTYAWAVSTTNRKIGDLFLIYLLPYIIWILVPTFGSSDDIDRKSIYKFNIWNASIFAIFNYILLIATSKEYVFWPILNQYAGPGFQISLYLILFSIMSELIYTKKSNKIKDEGWKYYHFLNSRNSGEKNK